MLVIVGATEYARKFMDIYGLHQSKSPTCCGRIARKVMDICGLRQCHTILLADFRPGFIGHEFCGQQVVDVGSIPPGDVDSYLIMTGWDIPEETVLAALADRGVDRSKCVTNFQPGKVHRAVMSLGVHRDANLSSIAYRAIYDDVFERAYYAYPTLLATDQARRMGLEEITVIECGVFAGTGLWNLWEMCDFLSQTTSMKFKVVGFDTGVGMPPSSDYRDHPELWRAGEMKMPDMEQLKRSLPPNAELILGDIRETVPAFLAERCDKKSPIGFLALDVDYYSSSVAALKLFDGHPEFYLPAVPVYVDDSYIHVMQNHFCGEALAISDFNARHELRKIDQKIVRTNREPRPWHHTMHFLHVFDHPLRCTHGLQTCFQQFYHTWY